MLDEYVWNLHEGMEPSAELDFMADLRRYKRNHPVPHNVYKLYAGGDPASLFDQALFRCWNARYDIDIRNETVVAAEHDTLKQSFLCTQFPEQDFILVDKVEQVLGDSVQNVRTRQQAMLPRVDTLGASYQEVWMLFVFTL